MEKHHDWLPSNHEALYNQSLQTKSHLDNHLKDFGIDGKSAEWVATEFNGKMKTFSNAFLEWQDPAERTKAKTVALRDATKNFAPAYRELYNGFLKNNPNVANEDLVKMGLPARSENKPVPSPVPSSYPELTIAPDGIRRVKVAFRDHDKMSLAKPHGVSGAVLRWAILPAPPTRVDELTNTMLDTKTPNIFSFEEDQRGKTLYVAAAWQNTRGERGDWSEIVWTIIP